MKLSNHEPAPGRLSFNRDSTRQPSCPDPASGRCPIRLFTLPLLETLFRMAVLLLALLSVALKVSACGPDFPNNLLGGGDAVLLAAPVADFERELQRLKLAPSRFAHVDATNSLAGEAMAAELSDLALALRRAKVPPEDSALIIESHRLNRVRLKEYLEAGADWEGKSWQGDDRGPRPAFPTVIEVEGLPGEFRDYFEGAIALRDPSGDTNKARLAWERLLARPDVERRFKSTWAAFMLGKSWEESDDDKAVEYFQRTRDLAKRGFADSIGLAAAALGWEARVEFRRKHYRRALELYLEQYASGDDSAVTSLRWVAAEALTAGAEELASLAAWKEGREVITAYLIHSQSRAQAVETGAAHDQFTRNWLAAVEAQELNDVEAAERLALAAYQAAEYELAGRWIKRARGTPVAQWLQAKLWLRSGQLAPAAALLSNVAKLLPVAEHATNAPMAEFADALQMDAGGDFLRPARQQLLGELGVLRLTRGEFSRALDALLRAGLWGDAAYVAERVLTTDELKRYVDSNWPAAERAVIAETEAEPQVVIARSATRGEDIRHLLARRLTREVRSREAREYYPAPWRSKHAELAAALDGGWDENAPPANRARAFVVAAWIARTNGMELLGTELAPDWFIYGGNYDWGLTWAGRAASTNGNQINRASESELARAAQPHVDPDERFHYRYQAAFLAWEAAKLMPDNSDETARVLCTAGTWLKVRDPDTADIFYKALVRRCRQTAIGEQADRMRWFPVLDEAGNPRPYRPRRTPPQPAGDGESGEQVGENVMAPEAMVLTDRQYVVQSGDTLTAIAAAAGVSVREIIEANPGLGLPLAVGRRILIPLPAEETSPP